MGMNGDERTLVEGHLWTDINGWKGPNGWNRTDVRRRTSDEITTERRQNNNEIMIERQTKWRNKTATALQNDPHP
jgi:hypothetical protein